MKGKGRVQGLAEQPQVKHKKDKGAEIGKGREDDFEWLIIDLCDDNGVFSFFFPPRDVTSRTDPNCIIQFLFRCIRHVTVTNISCSFRSSSDFQFTSQLSLQYCGFFTAIARTRSPLS